MTQSYTEEERLLCVSVRSSAFLCVPLLFYPFRWSHNWRVIWM